MSVGVYMDVHISRAIVVGLRLRGVHVLTAQEDGTATVSDARLLDRATELGMLLFTHDDDLLAEADKRIRAGTEFGGIVFSRFLRSPIGRCIDDLEIIAKSTEKSDLKNLIEFIPF